MKILLTTAVIALLLANKLNAQWTTGTNIYNQNTGNVGINTTTPSAKFSVNGTMLFGGHTANLDPSYLPNSFSYLANTGQLLVGWNRISGAGEADLITNRGAGSVGGFAFYDYGNTHVLKHLMSILGDGRVGIGLQNPNGKLQVNSNNQGTGTDNWITGNFGAISGDRVVFGLLNGVATIGAHNYALNEWSNLSLNADGGNVGIGTKSPKEKLSVNGNIRAKEVKVESTNWPDYVFEHDYSLPSLKDVEKFIHINKHLPNIPSAQDIKVSGQNLGEINSQLLRTIEELTLHLIEKDKQLNEQNIRIQLQEEKTKKIEKVLDELLKKGK